MATTKIQYNLYYGQKAYSGIIPSLGGKPNGGIGCGNCVDRRNWYTNITNMKGKHFEHLDLNMAFYEYEAGKDSGGSEVDRSSILPNVTGISDNYSGFESGVEAARSAGMSSGNAYPQLMLENYMLRPDRFLHAWTTESEGEDGDGHKTITITHHTRVESKAPPYSQGEIELLTGATFTNCIIGGPYNDFLSYDVGKDHNVIELLELPYMNLRGAVFTNCRIKGTKVFNHSDLNGAKFINCLIEDVDFSLCDNPYEYCDSYLEAKEAFLAVDENMAEFWNESRVPPYPSVIGRIDTYKRAAAKAAREQVSLLDDTLDEIDDYTYTYRGEASYIDFTGSYLKNCKFGKGANIVYKWIRGVDSNGLFNGWAVESTTSKNGDYTGLNLTNTKLHNCIVNQTYFTHPTINNTKFTECNFNDTRVVNCTNYSPEADRGVLILTGVPINNSYISGVKIENYDFTIRGFVHSYITRCILNNCNFRNLDLSNTSAALCQINNCDFSNTNLTKFSFQGSVINNSNISNFSAQKYGFPNIKAVIISNSQFSTSADGSYSDSVSVVLTNIDIINMQLISVNMNNSKLNSVNLVNCNLNGATLYRANLNNVVFENCQLRSAKFDNGVLQNTRFINCDIRGASFNDCAGASLNIFNTCNTNGIDL